jgi:hypothetical protein
MARALAICVWLGASVAPLLAQQAPASGFPETLARAEAASAAKEWKEAAALWERVVHDNPVESRFWAALATARYSAGDFKGAIPAYEKAAELGNAPASQVYNIACCYALLGDKERAMQALERAMAMGYPSTTGPPNDADLKLLYDDPRFKKLFGTEDVSRLSRDEGWRYDLALLAREAKRKGFRVPRDITPADFDVRVRALHDAIPRLTDGQVVLELTRLVVALGDGHSAVLGSMENPLFLSTLPMQFYWFDEGLFVVSAAPQHKELLGAQVLELDGRPAAELLEAMVPYVNRDRGNAMWPKQRAPYMLRHLPLLHADGLIKDPKRVTLTIKALDGATRKVEVAADTTEPNIWNTLPNPKSWVNLASTLGDAVPLYLKNMDRRYWFEYLPERRVVYFQFNSVRNDEQESLAQFTERLMKFIAEHDVEKLVIDMRWNNGGNTFLTRPLVRELIRNDKVNQRGKLFVIVGRRTYSAAQNTTTYIERYTNAIFVGEPTGSSPNFVGEEDVTILPYSKIVANVSNLYWQSSWPMDERMWIAPQIYTPPTFADFRAGRDRALDAVLEYPAPK